MTDERPAPGRPGEPPNVASGLPRGTKNPARDLSKNVMGHSIDNLLLHLGKLSEAKLLVTDVATNASIGDATKWKLDEAVKLLTEVQTYLIPLK